jgi:hypothetical protein
VKLNIIKTEYLYSGSDIQNMKTEDNSEINKQNIPRQEGNKNLEWPTFRYTFNKRQRREYFTQWWTAPYATAVKLGQWTTN